MKKLCLLYLLSILSLTFINCKSLNTVQVQFDPTTNTLICKGKSYEISELETIYQDQYEPEIPEPKSFNSEEKKVIVFLMDFGLIL